MQQTLLDLSFEELENVVIALKQPKFRAKQIFEGVYSGKSISEISNISKELKELLLKDYYDSTVSIYKSLKSKDGTEKFVLKFNDGEIVENVLMKYEYGKTLCISTQVGCRMNCSFCASGLNGLIRNLTAGEILSQVLVINKYLNGDVRKREITNLVLMGSGEPLDNYDNVVKFLKLVSSVQGINISLRNISVSTCGLIDKIDMLAKENLPITLAISLHAPNGDIRKSIMPISKIYDYDKLIEAVKNYEKQNHRRVVFEYCLIKGKNDSVLCANELAKKLKGINALVNVICLNDVKERNLLGTTRKYAYYFVDLLKKQGINATVRRSMGEDIEGACGQLRNKVIENDN